MDGDLDGDTVHTVETLVGAAEVGAGSTSIPVLAVDHQAGAEVSVPLAVVLRFLSGGLVDETLAGVDLIGEMEIVEIPFQVDVEDGSLESEVHEDVASKVETESIHETNIGGVESAVVTLTVVHGDGTDATVQFVDVLVVRDRGRLVSAGERRPLTAVGEGETRSDFRAGHCGVEIQRVGVELGESDVLGVNTL